MHSNLSDHQLKIDCYIHRLLYMNLNTTINQKPTIDTQKLKRKKLKHNTKQIHQTTRKQENREL